MIISHYFMTSLNLEKISNCYTKVNTMVLLEMILNRSLAGYKYYELHCN